MTSTETEQAKIDPGEYNRLVAHAKVQSIRLINARYDVKPTALASPREDLVYNVSQQLLDWHCDSETLLLSGTWEYKAACVAGKSKLLTVIARYLVTYRLSAVCDENAGREFYERVARFSAYPYFRGTFAMLTQQSGILLPPLPIMSEQPRWVTPPEDLASKSAPTSSRPKTMPQPKKGAKSAKKV